MNGAALEILLRFLVLVVSLLEQFQSRVGAPLLRLRMDQGGAIVDASFCVAVVELGLF